LHFSQTNLCSQNYLVTICLLPSTHLHGNSLFLIVVAINPNFGATCAPFGGGSSLQSNYWFYRYANLPAFTLEMGDLLAFDLGLANEFIPAFASIAVATPSEDSAGSYTPIVYPSVGSSKGDTIIGNFELNFTISAPYSFPGGALIMRFKNGGLAATSSGYSGDTSCTPNLVGGDASDSSG
jgi:hypothetical protein